jgi:hypothetical protein
MTVYGSATPLVTLAPLLSQTLSYAETEFNNGGIGERAVRGLHSYYLNTYGIEPMRMPKL